MRRLLLPLLLISSLAHANTVYILVHGTWGADGKWHKPNGSFFQTLEEKIREHKGRIVTFTWSGNNNHKARIQAAQELEALITSYPPTHKIIIVSHSHGTNVVALTSHFLRDRSDNHHIIHAVYAFGTPVDPDRYMPNMQMIKYFYHFFSLNDFVQPVLGMFSREYPRTDRIANIRITINGSQPSHNKLHSPLVAAWIPDIHLLLGQERVGNFVNFDFKQPGVIQFESDSPPLYGIDLRRKALLEKDTSRRMAIASHLNQALKKQTLGLEASISRSATLSRATGGQKDE